jgi:Glycosyltransferase family 87
MASSSGAPDAWLRRPRVGRSFAMLLLSCVLLAGVYRSGALSELPINDFLEYWTAARLALANQNPYSQTAMYAEEERLGLKSEKPLMMWNPPWVVPFMAPFGMLRLHTARALFFVVTFIVVFGCAEWLWRFYGGASNRYWVVWLLTCTFAPTIVSLTSGQVSPLLLLGVVAFLRASHRRSYFAAGLSMLFIAFKPHLLYLLWMEVVLWAAKSPRRLRLLLGAVLTLTSATAVALVFNHAILTEYLIAWKAEPMLVLYAPAMGGLLRSAFGWQRYWLQFVPAFAGIVWCLWWQWKQAWNDFSWSRTLPVLLAVSVCTSPYGWLFDQVVLLPALMERAAGLGRNGNKIAAIWIAVYFAANAGIAVLLAFRQGMLSQAYAWTAPLWCLLYFATAGVSQSASVADSSK